MIVLLNVKESFNKSWLKKEAKFKEKGGLYIIIILYIIIYYYINFLIIQKKWKTWFVTNNLECIANTFLEMSKKAGADSAEVIILEQESISVDTLNGSLESIERSEGIDVGLRVILNNRQACIS